VSVDFLLEIGTEEIPHWMIPGALKDLFEGPPPQPTGPSGRYATPTSTCLFAHKTCLKSRPLPMSRSWDRLRVRFPPPLTGFAKKMGVTIDQLEVVSTEKGRILSVRKEGHGRAICRCPFWCPTRINSWNPLAENDVLGTDRISFSFVQFGGSSPY